MHIVRPRKNTLAKFEELRSQDWTRFVMESPKDAHGKTMSPDAEEVRHNEPTATEPSRN